MGDTDQDKWQGGNCARSYGGGGWWYNNCGNVRPTGLHRRLKERRKRSHAAKNIVYYSGGERGNSFDSWMEAEFILIPVSYLYGPDGQIGPRQIGSLKMLLLPLESRTPKFTNTVMKHMIRE